MKTRIDASTDIATIGAWDSGRNAPLPSAKVWDKEYNDALESDATAGHLFMVHTGADGSSLIDLLVDETIPASLLEQTKPQGREYLLRVPSGQLVVGGVEDYRAAKPQITGPDSVTKIPPGNYLLKCHVSTVEETSDGPTLQQILGPDDYRYYRGIRKRAGLACLIIPLSLMLLFPLGSKLALGITAAVAVAYFLLFQGDLLKRNSRSQRILAAVKKARRKAEQMRLPTLIFELRTVADIAELKGGSLKLDWKA